MESSSCEYFPNLWEEGSVIRALEAGKPGMTQGPNPAGSHLSVPRCHSTMAMS